MSPSQVYARSAVRVAAPAAVVFDAVTSWDAQHEWMLGTHVACVDGDPQGVGGTIEAWTGVGPLGFLDTMVITAWDATQHLVEVDHIGPAFTGWGRVRAVAVGLEETILLWEEGIDMPLGVLGRMAWPLAKPAFMEGIRLSLHTLGRLCEQRWTGEMPVESPSRVS